MNRRQFIRNSTGAAMAVSPAINTLGASSQKGKVKVEVLNPQNRVPVSMIIDDSTALVNLAHFGIPQFAEVFPDQYQQDWRKLPREIPDAFVAEFIEWCDLHGVKGKYSMVPYPACTGWLHRNIPGWSAAELKSSLDLVRNEVTKNWDIHPEMISHTRVIDIRTGLPFPYATPDYMENWEWSQERSRDELSGYIHYALNILKEAGFYCDGVTTPGGFCHRNIPNLAAATHDAVKDLFKANISHFFRDVISEGDASVAPVVVHEENTNSNELSCSVHIIGCTDDWFGGWDGLVRGDADKFITHDLGKGRMVDIIDRGEPAIMVCHWPGIYFNGEKAGFNIFKTVVDRLEQKYADSIQWLKLSEIARYWAAKKYISFKPVDEGIEIYSPFAVDDLTIRIDKKLTKPSILHGADPVYLSESSAANGLKSNTYFINKGIALACFHLPKGKSIFRGI
ncbi:MAG: hypothetical protein U5K79_22195 [Cyclobacteriaceae bacterium]|nr:hypothetical protein [Cyclobacteriaceae bacterium]